MVIVDVQVVAQLYHPCVRRDVTTPIELLLVIYVAKLISGNVLVLSRHVIQIFTYHALTGSHTWCRPLWGRHIR